ncbi:MAG: hypothetical protein ACOCW2_01835, partial [Chitinivibrionales bacterium]
MGGLIRAEYAPNLNHDETLDRFMRQLSSRYELSLPADFWIKPTTVSEVLSFMEKADSLNREGLLSQQEAFMLKRASKQIAGERKLFSWYNSVNQTRTHVGISLIGDITPSYEDSETS